MKLNLTKIINNKLIVCLPKNNIFYLPHNNKKINKEMVLRIVLSTPEPDEKLSLEEKLEYHKKQNDSFVNKYKDKLSDLLYADSSLIDNEVWLVFKNESQETIEYLTSLSEVQIIYHYNQNTGGYYFKSDYHINFNQDDIIKEINSKFIISPEKIKQKVTEHNADSIEVKNILYNENTKTITVDLNNYQSEEAICQLFSYIDSQGENYQEIINRLSSIISHEILKKYKDKQFTRINFVINAQGWPKNSPNRYIQLFPPCLKNIKTEKNFHWQYLRNESYFNNSNLENEIKESIPSSLIVYKELLKAIRSQGPDILDLISKLDPKQIKVEEIRNAGTVGRALYVKFSVFDTQEKMDILYSYLADEPYNKYQWIKRIKELIIEAIEKNDLGKLEDYSFITFDENYTSSNISVKHAAIGGIELKRGYYDLDNDDEEVKELFYNIDGEFGSEDDFERHIDLNIKWNRHIYLSYYYKGNDSIYNYIKRPKRAVSLTQINEYYWNIYGDLLNTISSTVEQKGDNDIIINFNGFRSLESFKVLLFLIGNDASNSNNEKWITKLVSIIKNALTTNSNKNKQIKNVYVKINDDTSSPFLWLDISNIPSDFKKDSYDFNDDKDIKSILLSNIKRLNPKLTILAIDLGVIPNGLADCAYAMQFATVGLSSLFNNIKAEATSFADKENCIGILEAEGGVIDIDEVLHFSRDRLVTETENSVTSNHANLVGRILGSQKDGVDRTSKIVSAGFKFSSQKENKAWNALKAIDWLVSQKIKILNCSWNNSKRRKEDPDFITYSDLAYKLDYISRKYGIVVFKSAGNDHVHFKPYFRDVGLAFNAIFVGSTTADGSRLSTFSDYEKLEQYRMTKEAPKPLLVAPGEAYSYLNRRYDGTSFASPLVAGTVSMLMKEYETKLKDKPAGVMAVLAASSDDKYPGYFNVNGLKYETGAGLLNYEDARIATRNLTNTEIKCDVDVGHRVYESGEFMAGNYETIIVSTACLYNGGYVTSIDLPEQKPTKGGISSVPIIGYLYLTYAYIFNNFQNRKFDSQFEDKKAQILKLDKSINVNDLDSYLMPANLTATLQVQDPNTKKWTNVEWLNKDNSHYSNIKRYEYQNELGIRKFKYIITVCKEGKYVSGDHTRNVVAFTHVVKTN